MNRLKGTTVYLAGPVERDDNCAPWREQISEALYPLGINIWSPLNYPEWFKEKCGGSISPQIQRNDKNCLTRLVQMDKWNGDRILERNITIRNTCLRLVSASDWIVCKVSGPTVGTFEEINVAKQQGKPVLFFSDDENLDSCWRAAQFYNDYKIWFNSLDGIVERIKGINDGSVVVDKLEWIFIKDFGWNTWSPNED